MNYLSKRRISNEKIQYLIHRLEGIFLNFTCFILPINKSWICLIVCESLSWYVEVLKESYPLMRFLCYELSKHCSITSTTKKTLLTCLSKVTSGIHITVYITSKRLPILQNIKMTFTRLFLVSNINGPVSLSGIDFRTYLAKWCTTMCHSGIHGPGLGKF